MANRRCKVCLMNLDGGRGYLLQRWSWEKMRWRYAGSLCNECFEKMLKAAKRCCR